MDSEKNAHMRELLENGRPVTDEGPFYHHAWWESYKGGVKGKLGGGLLGAGIGAIVGLGAAGVAVALAPVGIAIGATAVGLTVAGFSGAGMLYGVHEFAEVGQVAGAVAATQKTAEKRMKAYVDAKFDEIQESTGELKALIKGEPVPEKKAEAATAALKAEQDDYRTEHFQGSTPETNKFIFWKVAAVGLAIGLVAGAILATGGMATQVLHVLGVTGANSALGIVAEYAACMTAMGAIGASFGINRDIFRQAFDKTDMWFRGFISHEHSKQVLLSPELSKAVEKAQEEPKKETVLYNNSYINYPESNTHHQDSYAAAKKALLDLDPSKVPAH